MKLDSKVYDVLKNIAQIYLPALATLYVTLAAIWSLPAAQNISLTALAVDTFLGLVLKISTNTFNNSITEQGGKFGGTLTLEGSQIRLTSVDQNALANYSEITFQIVKASAPDPDLAGTTVRTATNPPVPPVS